MEAGSASAAPDLPEDCPLQAFVSLVSGKWAIPILYRLIDAREPLRFGQLQRLTEPITQKELTKHLRVLESRGLVERTAYLEMPPRVEYKATPVAMELIHSLEAIAKWMEFYGRDLMKKTMGSDAVDSLQSGTEPPR